MKNILLKIEFILLFVIAPLLILTFRHKFKFILLTSLILSCIFVLIYLLFDRDFSVKQLWHTEEFGIHFIKLMFRFFIGGALITIACFFFNRKLFLSFPQNRTHLWALIMIFYPIASVFPQEIIYRVFFFHRYSTLFKNEKVMILICGLCFGLIHLFLLNWLAILLSTIGGIMFSYTYSKSKSVILASIEHALWGDLIFTIGLGIYFYSGAIK